MSTPTRIDTSQWSKEAQVEYRALEKETESLQVEIAVIKDKMINAKEEGKTELYNELDIKIAFLRREKTKLTNRMRYRVERNGNIVRTTRHEGMKPEERVIFLEDLQNERMAVQLEINTLRDELVTLNAVNPPKKSLILSKNKKIEANIKKRQNLASRIVYHTRKARKEKKENEQPHD